MTDLDTFVIELDASWSLIDEMDDSYDGVMTVMKSSANALSKAGVSMKDLDDAFGERYTDYHQRERIMSNKELINIHLNNSDLNLTNLVAIHNSSVAIVRSILVEYYNTKDFIHPILK